MNFEFEEQGIKFSWLYQQLRSGKKIRAEGIDRGSSGKPSSHQEYPEFPQTLRYPEEDKMIPVVYIWTNPQFTHTFAKLVDGREVNFRLSFMDVIWHSFAEYEEPVPPKRGWRDVFDTKVSMGGYSACRNLANISGYEYLTFNDKVYSVKDSHMTQPICLVEDIEKVSRG